MVGTRCIISGCGNVYRRDKHVSFHEFPSDQSASHKWIQLLEEKGLISHDFRISAWMLREWREENEITKVSHAVSFFERKF